MTRLGRHSVAGRLLRDRGAQMAVLLLGVVASGALLAPILAPYPEDAGLASHVDQRLQPPSEQFWFGTDQLGRDVFSRVLFGGQVSLAIGAASMLLSALVGTAIGLVAGYGPGWLEEALMRMADVFLGIPLLVLAVLVSLTLGGGIEMSAVAIAAGTWPRYARLVRGEVMRTKILEFVEAAHSYGAPTRIIVLRHILPGVRPTLMTQAALQFGNAILVVAALGFIGLGARPPSPEWGLSIAIGREYLPESWWISLFPGLFIFIAVFSLSLLSDAGQRAFDVRLQRKAG